MSARARLDSLLAQYRLTAWTELIDAVVTEALAEQAAEARQLQNDITGACLARYEEEQENTRLRLAWQSARERAQAYGEGILRHVEERDSYAKWLEQEQAVTQQLRAQVAELLKERHSTNEALSDAAEQLRVQRDRIAELEAQLPATQEPENPFRPCGCPERFDRHAWGCPTVPEDPHTSELHHDYALGRDLPTIPRQVTGRCPSCNGTFEDCTCGSGS